MIAINPTQLVLYGFSLLAHAAVCVAHLGVTLSSLHTPKSKKQPLSCPQSVQCDGVR